MDFTREPIIETIITPKEGCKLVVRSSKSNGQEEYFVDSLEVVVFGSGLFFRSLERPKAFIVPASDYEVLEIREAKVALKNVSIEKSIKIGSKQHKEPVQEKSEVMAAKAAPSAEIEGSQPEQKSETKTDRKRDRRRHGRRRRGAGGEGEEDLAEVTTVKEAENGTSVPLATGEEIAEKNATPPPKPKPLLPPPETLISETIARYRDNALFQGAFYVKKEELEEGEGMPEAETDNDATLHFRPQDDLMEPIDLQNVVLETPEFGSFGAPEEPLTYDPEKL